MPFIKTKTEEPYPSAWRSGSFDESPLEVLEVRLRGADKDLRGRTAIRLRDAGPAAVPALCEALKDPDACVRAAAVESLAEIGDARSIMPLMAALKKCFDTGSARRQRVLGVVSFLGVAVVIAFLAIGTIKGWTAGGFVTTWLFLSRNIGDYFNRRRSRGPQIIALTRAIDRIAAREPTPELRLLLPELQSVASDPLYQSAETRAVTREVAERITALTERIKSMPVAATAPQMEPDQFPIAAGS